LFLAAKLVNHPFLFPRREDLKICVYLGLFGVVGNHLGNVLGVKLTGPFNAALFQVI